MINEAINKLAEKQNLTGAETIGAFGEIMTVKLLMLKLRRLLRLCV